jgi:hypothetical protein
MKGVVKNVAFTNGRMAGSSQSKVASFIANGIAGTLENVFVHIDLENSTIDNAGQMNVFAYGFNSTASIQNCGAYVSGASSQNGCQKIRLGNFSHGAMTDVVNTYLVYNDALSVAGLLSNDVTIACTETQVKNGATFSTAGFSSVWDTTTYKMPIFTTAATYLNLESFKK